VKFFIATLATETNTFSPIPTGMPAFTEGREYYRNDGSRHPPSLGNIPLIEWRRLAEADGHTVAESICSFAQPAGTTMQNVYETLRDMVLADLRAAMPVDVVLLFMHGAMVAHGYDDCEGDTLARVRDIVGSDAVVGMELDLHCHLTELKREKADVIIAFKEYPHIDVAERARELYAICARAARGEIEPVMAYYDCRMINMWRTPVEPMKGFVARMQALEGRDGVLSVSFGHGFPWSDVPDVGAKILVVADRDEKKARDVAARLGRELWELRQKMLTPHDDPDAAIDAALKQDGRGPLVIADVADNAGGGAPSDNTIILRRLVERGVKDAAIGCFWDPVAVSFCREAGVGASFDLRIGGKCGVASGDPVDLHVTVRGLSERHTAPGLSGGRINLGPSAWVSADGIDIVLISVRHQTFHPEAFEGLGCKLADKRLVVVKSTQHFYAGFAPIAKSVRYVATAGAIAPEFDKIPYTRKTEPYWPRVDDPFSGSNRP
jgi:microcystin degradation protein MlrC